MINRACPVIVLDDKKEHLWAISHGLSVCGFPVMPHWVCDKQLEFEPPEPYQGIRIVFTDLHLLGDDESKVETLVSALVSFLRKLVAPSSYLLIFWSEYDKEVDAAWSLLQKRLKDKSLLPFGCKAISKTEVLNIAVADRDISAKAVTKVRAEIETILSGLPQLKAIINMESCISSASAKATNGLLEALRQSGVEFTQTDNLRTVMQRMSQEALGSAHASSAPAKGFAQALLPILQDCIERITDEQMSHLVAFLGNVGKKKIALPSAGISSRLNNYFIHAEDNVVGPLERGALINLSEEYLSAEQHGFCDRIGLNGDSPGDWRESICNEFVPEWRGSRESSKSKALKASLSPRNVFAVELSPECDHAQNKQRSQRFFVSFFVPTTDLASFTKLDKSGNRNLEPAHAAIYVTPEIFLRDTAGHLLVSCRVFIAKPHTKSPPGQWISRLRKDSVEELAHHYASHMRRPGKIFFD